MSRLAERGVALRDLQEAVKHGEQRRTADQGSSAFHHQGLVYITDATGQVGVTAWRSAVREESQKVLGKRRFDEAARGWGNESIGHRVKIENLPIVAGAKRDKLINMLRKFFSQVAPVVESGIEMPMNEDEMSLGYAFIVFSSEEHAAKAAKLADGYKLDKWHVFTVPRPWPGETGGGRDAVSWSIAQSKA